MNTSNVNPENNFLNSIKQFPAFIFGSPSQNNVSSEQYPILRIQIQRIEIIHNLKMPDFSPYISIKIGNETKKTTTNSHRDPHNAIFNEVREIKRFYNYLNENLNSTSNIKMCPSKTIWWFPSFTKAILFFPTNMYYWPFFSIWN